MQTDKLLMIARETIDRVRAAIVDVARECEVVGLEVTAFEATPERREVRLKLDARQARAGIIRELAAVVRGVVGIVWYGVQTYFASKAVQVLVKKKLDPDRVRQAISGSGTGVKEVRSLGAAWLRCRRVRAAEQHLESPDLVLEKHRELADPG